MWRNRRFETPKPLRRDIEKEILSPALLFGPKLIMVARKPLAEEPTEAQIDPTQ
ncbi:MAG: hypothetical protein OSB12_04590 [Planctomycetota bacterium]|nr:hypothetical protein [Planctomycetota bacterium]